MFEGLSSKLNQTFKKLTNKGILTETNIAVSLKEVKMALLDADVNYRVVNAFLKAVKSRALGVEVMGALSPGQQFIKIVNDELVNLMKSDSHGLTLSSNQLTIVMMVGLQGSGKTTTVAKLAKRLQQDGKSVYLVSADIYRPAAIEQLQTLAQDLSIPCFPSLTTMNPVEIVCQAKKEAERCFAKCMIIDTAGRLHIDEQLMDELQNIKSKVLVDEILFVADAMTGQEAVNVAHTFHKKLEITGFILTKMDGDARGGAALSMRSITGVPIKFVGMGETIADLEPFVPDRIASKILGMGDIVGLIEKTHQHFDQAKARVLAERIRKNSFSLSDFREQLSQIKKMGPLKDLLSMIPGMSNNQRIDAAGMDETILGKIDAIISSMTPKERENHHLMNGSRKLRIAKGSGTQVNDINRLLKQFVQMKKMMKKFSSLGPNRKSMRYLNDMLEMKGR